MTQTPDISAHSSKADGSVSVVARLQDEIYEWVRKQETWKQDLFLRAAAAPELEPNDAEAVAEFLLGKPEGGAGPREVTRDLLPAGEDGAEPMVIERIARRSTTIRPLSAEPPSTQSGWDGSGDLNRTATSSASGWSPSTAIPSKNLFHNDLSLRQQTIAQANKLSARSRNGDTPSAA